MLTGNKMESQSGRGKFPADSFFGSICSMLILCEKKKSNPSCWFSATKRRKNPPHFEIFDYLQNLPNGRDDSKEVAKQTDDRNVHRDQSEMDLESKH